MFRDIESYFIDLKLEFIHELFTAMFKIMIVSYRALAEKFIAFTKQKKKDELESLERAATESSSRGKEKGKNNTINEIKYFDSMIRYLEEEEKRLCEKRNIVERQLVFEREIIENITPSDAVQQIGVLIRQFDRIIMHSELLCDSESHLSGEDYAKNMILSKCVDSIPQEYCENIEQATKTKFMAAMHRLAAKMYDRVRQAEKQEIIKEINMEKLAK